MRNVRQHVKQCVECKAQELSTVGPSHSGANLPARMQNDCVVPGNTGFDRADFNIACDRPLIKFDAIEFIAS